MINDIDKRTAYIAVISARRPDAPKRMHELLGTDRVTWYVAEGEVDDYAAGGARSVVEVGALCRARNQALEDAFEADVPCIQLSDDLQRMEKPVYSHEKRKFISERITFADVFKGLVDALMTGAQLAGVAPTNNPFYYRGKSIHPRAFIVGDAICVGRTELRFDEDMRLKEDYDYTIQHLQKYGQVARRDDLLLTFAHRTNKGGAVEYRTSELERETIEYLRKKHPGWIKLNPKRADEILLNLR